MFVDARSLSDGDVVEADLCIVGAGAAGITLSRAFAGSSSKVVLVESGDEGPTAESLELNAASKSGLNYTDLETCRLRGLGGTTNHWEGSCNRFDPIDFAERPWVKWSGWPFQLSELEPYYERAHRLCELLPGSFDPAYWSARTGMALPRFADGVTEVGIALLSPPTRFGEKYGDELRNAANVTVILNATATAAEATAGSRELASIAFSRDGGKPFAVRARKFVLALGGLENPRFLLAANIGNDTDMVGRFFMEHPVIRGGLLLPAPTAELSVFRREGRREVIAGSDASIGVDLRLTEAAVLSEQTVNARIAVHPISRYEASLGIEAAHYLRNSLSDGKMPDGLFGQIGAVLGDLDMIAEGIARRSFGRRLFDSADQFACFELQCMIEQFPDPDNRVTLGSARDRFGMPQLHLHWSLGEQEGVLLRRTVDLVARSVGAAGLGRVQNAMHRADFTWPPRRLSYGYHHMGTTRSHKDPRQGVVDGNMRVHSHSNVYVAGSSVFPTGSHVPPTLTIVALALRLADHLKASL